MQALGVHAFRWRGICILPPLTTLPGGHHTSMDTLFFLVQETVGGGVYMLQNHIVFITLALSHNYDSGATGLFTIIPWFKSNKNLTFQATEVKSCKRVASWQKEQIFISSPWPIDVPVLNYSGVMTSPKGKAKGLWIFAPVLYREVCSLQRSVLRYVIPSCTML